MRDRHPEPSSSQRRGDALALIAAVFAAIFLLVFQDANAVAPREATVFVMLSVATLFNGAFASFRSRQRAKEAGRGRANLRAAIVLGLLTIGGNIGVAEALNHLDPGLTSTILQTQIFVVGLGGWALLQERITIRFVVGAVFAVAGFAVLSLDDPSAARVSVTGVLFALLASMSFGAMLLYTRKVIRDIEPVTVNVIRLILAVAVLAIYLIPQGALVQVPPRAWAMAGAAAFCGPFVSRLCLMFAARHITASRTKLITLTTPVFAFVLSVVVLGLVPGVRELVGAALILAGVVLPILRAKAYTS
jgi:drug/metabolite transporter (DMT)-like permease